MSKKVLESCLHDLPFPDNRVGETWQCGLCGLFFMPAKLTKLSDWYWQQRPTEMVLTEISMMEAVRGE